MELVLASANPDKQAEIGEILGSCSDLELLPRPADVPDVVEDGATLEDNAALKATALVRATGKAAVSDDTGLEVEALGGAPGVLSARYAGEHASYDDNVNKLLASLADRREPADRRAWFRTVALVAFPDGRQLMAEGVVGGHIASEKAGQGGFGYDPVFVPDDGDGRTFAQMSTEEKHALSHRGRAFRALADALTRWQHGELVRDVSGGDTALAGPS